MSQEQLDLVRRGLDAYQRRDVRSMSNVAHAQCEVFTFTVGVVEAQPFRGHAGIAKWMAHELEPWEDWRVEPAEFREQRIMRVWSYLNWHEALAAVGLRE